MVCACAMSNSARYIPSNAVASICCRFSVTMRRLAGFGAVAGAGAAYFLMKDNSKVVPASKLCAVM